MEKDFVIGKIFEKIDTEKIKGKAKDFPTEPIGDFQLPLLTAGIENQGLARYAKREQCPTILSNVISVSANGANSGVVFYHPEEFAVLQDAYAIKVRKYDIPNVEIGLFLTCSLYKAIASTHDWNYKAGWNRIKEDIFTLPIKTDKNDNPIIDDMHFYHNEGFIPDFDYMEKYITELEQERITELEQERITELEQYLLATGHNNYELTDKDVEVLLNFRRYHLDSAEICIKDFKISDLFRSENGDIDLQKKDINNKGVNVVSSGVSNNGYIGKTDKIAKIFPKNTITVDMFGFAFYRNIKYKMVTHARVFALLPLFEEMNEHIGQYIVSKLSSLSSVYNYSNMCSWAKIKNNVISLPFQTDINNNPIIDTECKFHPDGFIPDWEFIEQYIKAIEKIVIADVVRFKDDMIDKTKKVAGRVLFEV